MNCTGWSHHYVLKRKYHLIIPASDEWMKPLRKDSLEVTSSSSRHLMHGVIHCNGFGHLLCINSDNVSSFLSGDRAMDLWDRLCYYSSHQINWILFFTFLDYNSVFL